MVGSGERLWVEEGRLGVKIRFRSGYGDDYEEDW